VSHLTRVFIHVPWVDIFKFDPNYLENEESIRLSRPISWREARPTMSQDQRRVIARAMTKACSEDSYLTSYPIDIHQQNKK